MPRVPLYKNKEDIIMGKLVDELLEYLSNISDEQLSKDWNELKKFNEIGPEVTSFIEYSQEIIKQFYDPVVEVTVLNKTKNPDFNLDFFYFAA